MWKLKKEKEAKKENTSYNTSEETLPEHVRITPKAMALIEQFRIPFSAFAGQDFISEKEVLAFIQKDDLAFDHLCESLGQLMITFADFYMRGDKVRILDRLNSVKTGLFS